MYCEGSRIFVLLKINTSLMKTEREKHRCILTTYNITNERKPDALPSDRHIKVQWMHAKKYSLNMLLMQMIICKSNLRQQVHSFYIRDNSIERRHFFHSFIHHFCDIQLKLFIMP